MPARCYACRPVRRALIVIGKAPEAGSTKTRLAPVVTPDAAAALYRAFLLDAVELGLSLGWERVAVVHPRGGGALLRAILPDRAYLLEQPASGLADALACAFEREFADGFERVVLIGSDNPTLAAEPIEQACAALNGADDVSIGPSADGGYYLIGMRQPHLGLFEAIDWSTSRVYAQTLARAERLGLLVHPVRESYDVDTPEDLDRLRRELRSMLPGVAAHTRRALGATVAAPEP